MVRNGLIDVYRNDRRQIRSLNRDKWTGLILIRIKVRTFNNGNDW